MFSENSKHPRGIICFHFLALRARLTGKIPDVFKLDLNFSCFPMIKRTFLSFQGISRSNVGYSSQIPSIFRSHFFQ
jgi:hypothetical protein